MKKKGTRKIRKNKRTTQRWKNRSYKRMRGGGDRTKIMKLLKNLIINNSNPEIKLKLCKQQTPITPTATDQQQLVLPPVLLEHTKDVDKFIEKKYNNSIKPTDGKYQFPINLTENSNEKKILDLLKDQGITYFDKIVENQTFDILSPDEFKESLSVLRRPKLSVLIRSKLKVFNLQFDYDKLVNSMFVLSVRLCSIIKALGKEGFDFVFNMNDIKCPQTANV